MAMPPETPMPWIVKLMGCRGRKVLRLVKMERILPFAGWPLNP
jgi:hypothetical protein